MGGSSSKSNTNVKTKLVVEAVSRNIMNCSSNATAVQRTVISGDFNVLDGVKQVFTMKLSANCVQDAKSVATLQQSVANAIKASAKAQSVTLTGALGSSSSEVNVSIDNEVRQSITQENITNIVNKVNLEQELVVSGNHNIIKNYSQELTSDLVYANSQKLVNTLKSVQTIENTTDTASEATQKSMIAGVVGAIGGVIDSIFAGMNTMTMIFLAALLIGLYLGKDIIMGFLGIGPAADPNDPNQQRRMQDAQQRMGVNVQQRPPPQYMAQAPPVGYNLGMQQQPPAPMPQQQQPPAPMPQPQQSAMPPPLFTAPQAVP